MITLKESLQKSENLKIKNALKVDFYKELENKDFVDIIKDISLEEDKLYKYTSRLKDCSKEIEVQQKFINFFHIRSSLSFSIHL